MKRGYSYIKVPVSMIPMIYRGYTSICDILLYGVYDKARDIDADPENVTKHILYKFLNGNKNSLPLPKSIHDTLLQMDEDCPFIECNEDYRGFLGDGVTFWPEDEECNAVIDRLDDEFSDNSGLWNLAVEYYQVSHAFAFLELSYKGTRVLPTPTTA